MGAGVSQGEDALCAANQQNRHSLTHRSRWLGFRQLRIRQDRNEFTRETLPVGPIDAYPMFVNQFAPEVGGISHDCIPDSPGEPAAVAVSGSSQQQ
jgi:hypothetical protein